MPRRRKQPSPPHGPAATKTRKRMVRPIVSKLPPRIDLGNMSFDEAMGRLLSRKPHKSTPQGPTEYRCVTCGRQVWYPEIYYQDNRCQQCHEKAEGIEGQ